MKLRELFDNPDKPVEAQSASTTVGVCFGRFNPPHKGHKAAWETAARFNHFYVGTNQNTQGPNDPLPYNVKLAAMTAIWPKISGHVTPETNLFTLASFVYEKHGENVDLKIATDESWLTDALVKYSGVEGKHGCYKFKSIEQVPTPRLSSATALRDAVRNGNKDAFSSAAGVSADTPIKVGNNGAVPFFDLVKHYLDKFPEPVKKTKKAVAEARSERKPLRKSIKQSMPDLGSYDYLDNNSHPYMAYRFGVALAGSPDTDMQPRGPIGSDFTTVDYTDGDAEIRKGAEKVLGIKRSRSTGKGSEELDVINKVSPVAKPKRNKYGV